MERLICTNNGLKSFVVVIKTLWVNHHSSVVIFAWLVKENIGGWNPIVAVYIMLSL